MRLNNIIQTKVLALVLTIAALAAGHTKAQATVKTVKYRITAATTDDSNNYTLTFGLADDSDAPF